MTFAGGGTRREAENDLPLEPDQSAEPCEARPDVFNVRN
jgi:hypothetical protein